MSDANLEVVKQIFRDWARGDFSSADWADPQIEFRIPGPDSHVHHGVESMGRAWAEWLDAFDAFSVFAESFRDAGDKVVVEQIFRGKGKGSGVPIDEMPGAAVLTLRDGKVIRFEGYTTLEAALDSAGIAD
jgi:ketosteroid isomerase-like protein